MISDKSPKDQSRLPRNAEDQGQSRDPVRPTPYLPGRGGDSGGIIKGAGEAIDQWPSSWTCGSVTRGSGSGTPVQAEPASNGTRAPQSDLTARLPFGRTGPRYRSNQLTVS